MVYFTYSYILLNLPEKFCAFELVSFPQANKHDINVM